MFGRRKREEAAAAEAAREAERKALFAKLAERPESICPFLGLEADRAAYVDGVSDEHRCFAFGDPARLSAEQQTRVCQEPGYGNCPRYLRGVLVIPTDELQALRRKPVVPVAAPPPPPPPRAVSERRRRWPLLPLAFVGLILATVAVGAWAVLREDGTAVLPTPSPTATATLSPEPTRSPEAPSPTAEPTAAPPSGSGPATPSPEATPQPGDTFAFYEVSVAPGTYTLFALDAGGVVTGTRESTFASFSFARVQPRQGNNGGVYWETQVGGLSGWSYRWPESGDFRIRAVFLNDNGNRRSQYLDEDELGNLPTATPAPAP